MLGRSIFRQALAAAVVSIVLEQQVALRPIPPRPPVHTLRRLRRTMRRVARAQQPLTPSDKAMLMAAHAKRVRKAEQRLARGH